MRIFIPFTKLFSATYSACPGATLVPLHDTKDYAQYFQERWEEGKTFINVEHDVAPSIEVLKSLWRCPEKICLTGYVYDTKPGVAPEVTYLGCVKISEAFIKENPSLFDSFPDWSGCDGKIWQAAEDKKYPYCYHGEVKHLKG